MKKFKRTKLKWRNRWSQQELRLNVRLRHQKTQFKFAETNLNIAKKLQRIQLLISIEINFKNEYNINNGATNGKPTINPDTLGKICQPI